MSSFYCPKCGKEIIDTPEGYISFCEHYPRGKKVKVKKDKAFLEMVKLGKELKEEKVDKDYLIDNLIAFGKSFGTPDSWRKYHKEKQEYLAQQVEYQNKHICPKCFGKGYSTQLQADKVKIRYCSCSRGKDLVKYFRLKKDSDVQLERYKFRIPVDYKVLSLSTRSELIALAENEIKEWQLFLRDLNKTK